jgi:hypothetical protein
LPSSSKSCCNHPIQPRHGRSSTGRHQSSSHHRSHSWYHHSPVNTRQRTKGRPNYSWSHARLPEWSLWWKPSMIRSCPSQYCDCCTCLPCTS